MKLMKSVARRVALNLSESKRYSIINEQAIPAYATTLSNNWTYKNPFSAIPIAVDAQSFGRIGSEIVDPMMKIKFVFKIPWWRNFDTGKWGTVHLMVALVSCNDNFGNSTSFNNYDFSVNDPIWFLQSAVSRTTFNGNNVNILKTWKRRITPDEQVTVTPTGGASIQAFGTQDVVGSLYYKWKGKKTFEDAVIGSQPNFPSGINLKNNNYFLMVGWQANTGILPADRITCSMDTFMYWKDP